MIGAIDGKHKISEQPSYLGSHYCNYKGTDSVILMAVVSYLMVVVNINSCMQVLL